MTIYRFIKITNNDNHKMFYIDVTKMKDCRIRVGILYSQFFRRNYLEENKGHKTVYDILNSDYSFYCCYRCNCSSKDVKAIRNELYKFYNEKMRDYIAVEKSNRLIFI